MLYVGFTNHDLRGRLKAHLFGDSRKSTFRMSIGALLTPTLGLKPIGRLGRNYYRFEDEEPLSAWLRAQLQVSYRPCDGARASEKQLIKTFEPALNISDLRASPSARYLMQLRQQLAWRWSCK